MSADMAGRLGSGRRPTVPDRVTRFCKGGFRVTRTHPRPPAAACGGSSSAAWRRVRASPRRRGGPDRRAWDRGRLRLAFWGPNCRLLQSRGTRRGRWSLGPIGGCLRGTGARRTARHGRESGGGGGGSGSTYIAALESVEARAGRTAAGTLPPPAQASERASERASKQASKQASERASKGSTRGGGEGSSARRRKFRESQILSCYSCWSPCLISVQ